MKRFEDLEPKLLDLNPNYTAAAAIALHLKFLAASSQGLARLENIAEYSRSLDAGPAGADPQQAMCDQLLKISHNGLYHKH